MPSTYSNLKIQLMATGENSTTWGNVTNVNLGTAIEEAIVGSADVTFASGNVTISLTDTNATQTARNMRLRCTGTTGGSTRNLVVPSIEKPYIVQNDCADSVVVKTSAGTGITVPAGKTMWVYSDGTNVVDAVTHLTSLTLGTALAVTQGGTGSNTASGARTNLGLGTISTQNSNAVSITGGTLTGVNLSSSNVTITGGSISGITDLAVLDGGTGASNATDARTNLGLGTISTQNSSAVSITGGTLTGVNLSSSNVTITGGSVSGITDLAVADGGTGASNATNARINLLPSYTNNALKILRVNSGATDVEWATDSTGTVTSVGGTGTVNGITLTGTVTSSGNLTLGGALSGVSLTTQVTGTLPVTSGGTNATTISGARSSLGAAASGANTDITSLNPTGGLQIGAPTGGAQGTGTINATGLYVNGVAVGTGSGSVTSVNASGGTTGLSFSGGPITTSGTLTLSGTLAVPNGGTGASNATDARTNLGLGSLATLSSINNSNWSGTVLAVPNGGTGASDAATARSNLGAAASGANTDITALDQDVTITATGTIAADTIGFRGLPQNSQTASYTLALADAGKHISITTGGVVIPANSGGGSVAFPVGTTIVIFNNSGSNQTISINGTDVLRQAGTANTGSRTLAQYGLATCVKVASTTWVISGAGVS